MKERREKQNSQEWFDGEIAEETKDVINYSKIYNAAKYKLQKMIFNKKERF